MTELLARVAMALEPLEKRLSTGMALAFELGERAALKRFAKTFREFDGSGRSQLTEPDRARYRTLVDMLESAEPTAAAH